jgi:uncharacterized membrane protein
VPEVVFCVCEEELRGVDTKSLVCHMAAWSYFMSTKNPTNTCRICTRPGASGSVTSAPTPTLLREIMLHRMFLASACGLMFFSSFNASSGDRPSSSGAADQGPSNRSIISVETSVVIQRPVREVFAFVSDAENDIHWRSEVVSMKNVTPKPYGAGTRTVEVAKVLGKQLETTTEIVEFEPDVRMSRRTLSSQTPVTTARSVLAVEGGTRFTYKLRADVTDVFMFRLFRPILQWWTQRKVEGYMAKLKDIMESPGAPPPR